MSFSIEKLVIIRNTRISGNSGSVHVFTQDETRQMTNEYKDLPLIPVLWIRQCDQVHFDFRLFPIEILRKNFVLRQSLHAQGHSSGFYYPVMAILWEQGIKVQQRVGFILSE